MNAFQFGYQVKVALRKRAATAAEMLAPYGSANPGSIYPFSPDPAKHPEYAPNTPPETFRGTKVEADIPPKMFGGSNIGADASDNLFNVHQRQQSGQGLHLGGIGGDAPTMEEMKTRNQAMRGGQAARAAGDSALSRATGGMKSMQAPPVLPQGAPRSPMAQPPRGLGSAARR